MLYYFILCECLVFFFILLEICQGESVELKFQMTGSGPWDVSFTNGKFSPEFHSSVCILNLYTVLFIYFFYLF